MDCLGAPMQGSTDPQLADSAVVTTAPLVRTDLPSPLPSELPSPETKSLVAAPDRSLAEMPGLHVVDTTMFWSATGGGVRRYITTKRAWLQEMPGWRHTVVVPRASEAGLVDCGGIEIPGSGGYSLPRRRAQSAQVLDSLAPDLIEAGDPYQLAWSTLDAARRRPVPSVLFCHSNIAALAARLVGGPPGNNGWRSTLNTLLGRRVLAEGARHVAQAYLARTAQQFDLVLAPSEAMTRELHEMGVTSAQHQPLGVDTSVFNPEARDSIWRYALGLPAGARVLLYAGRFAPEKNLSVLVEAVQWLGPRYWLLAIGDGPQPPKGERVRVLPYQRQAPLLARAIASVDAFVHAGDQETFGLGVLEAMACGTPVAVRDAGGLGELVADEAGIAVRSAQVDEWAEAIESLFGTHRNRWVQAGLARAQQYRWDAVLPMLARRYLRLRHQQPDFSSGARGVPGLLQQEGSSS